MEQEHSGELDEVRASDNPVMKNRDKYKLCFMFGVHAGRFSSRYHMFVVRGRGPKRMKLECEEGH